MKTKKILGKKIIFLTLWTGLVTFQSCKKEETEPTVPVPVESLEITGTTWTSIAPSFVSNERIMAIGTVNDEMIMSFLDYPGSSEYYLSGHLTSSGDIHKHTMNTSGTGLGFEKIEIIENEVFGLGMWNTNGLWKFNVNTFTSTVWNGWSPEGSVGTSLNAISKYGTDRIEAYSNSPYVRSASGNITFPDVQGTGIVINDMIEYNGNLIIAGKFSSYNGVTLNNIAIWNGTGWDPLDIGVNDVINDLEILNGELIVGGKFTSAGGNSNCLKIAKWNSSGWNSMSTGLQGGLNGVRKLFVYENQLFVGGDFLGSGSINSANIIKWKNGTWIGLPNTINDPIGEIGVYNGHLYIANAFNIVGGNFLMKLE